MKVTRLAHGVPVGGELDYLDEGTLVGGDPQPDAALTVSQCQIALRPAGRNRILAKVLLRKCCVRRIACSLKPIGAALSVTASMTSRRVRPRYAGIRRVAAAPGHRSGPQEGRMHPAGRGRRDGSSARNGCSDRLAIVEVACWRAAYNSGSILFAVPEHRPQRRPVADGRKLAGRPCPKRLQRGVAGLRCQDADAEFHPQGARRRRLRHDPGNEVDRLALPPAQRLEQGPLRRRAVRMGQPRRMAGVPAAGVAGAERMRRSVPPDVQASRSAAIA